ncbi:MAG: YdcF family protein [Lachnospiraceae bacterium]|nr:YdcF family protein [Lachnospiraceae bacterium]
MKINRKILVITGIVFLLIGIAVILLKGSSYTLRFSVPASVGDAASADDFTVSVEQDGEIVRVTDKRLEKGELALTLRSVSRGKAYVHAAGPEGFSRMEVVYVHLFGIITVNSYFGNLSGAAVIPVLVTLYLVLLLWYVIVQYRRGMRTSLYRTANIRNLGWIIFLILMIVGQIPHLLSGNSLVTAVSRTMGSASNVAYIAFPVAFIVSVLVALSNLQLMRKEGRNWRNMLGLMLGLLVCLGTVFPFVLSELLQRSTIIDVHNERSAAPYVEMAVMNSILVTVSYLECILLGTVILAVKAARKVPAFDKDYILILGCQIRKDGTVTPLLKGRADRALEFARLQKESTGKDIIFVPSGGQGSDEVIAEARAVRNYLIETGIPEDRILTEDRSTSTYENFKYSMELIRKDWGLGGASERTELSEPRIAFSTTNYHVLRSGILAEQQGIRAEGIGSRTRTYFWINAFVREFIATVYAEWKTHLKVIAALILLTLVMVLLVCLSNIL